MESNVRRTLGSLLQLVPGCLLLLRRMPSRLYPVSPYCDRDNVIQLQRDNGCAAARGSENEMLGTQTIAASIAGSVTNALPELLGDVFAHDASGSRNPRRTASRVAIALRNSPS